VNQQARAYPSVHKRALSGCGESLTDEDVAVWRQQLQDAVDTAHQHGADVGGHDPSMRLKSDRHGLGATLGAYLDAIDADASRDAP
jgi:hypothetical protein